MKKGKVSFWVAIIISLAAVISLYVTIQYIYRPVKTVIVTNAIQTGEQLQADNLKEDKVFAADLSPKAIRTIEEAVGMFATSPLYPGEQLTTSRVMKEPDKITGAFSYLESDETYISFNSSEAKWPKGIKEGDTVTVVAVMAENAIVVGQGLRVIGTDKPVPILGQFEAIKQSVPDNASTITIAISRDEATDLLHSMSKSKLFYFLPEHPKLS